MDTRSTSETQPLYAYNSTSRCYYHALLSSDIKAASLTNQKLLCTVIETQRGTTIETGESRFQKSEGKMVDTIEIDWCFSEI
ncbi:hypothetical protein RvY_05081 [Ramazzottius varieornatus]|uniref:Uncharacterized protein n=1 Tax=Ramazzottius varieornatus TaxID=947166 RepID=A0A1D1V2W2_RAMVA|nr:hypothetical protein RvY_05081 [Ramazzottius varieornatus]